MKRESNAHRKCHPRLYMTQESDEKIINSLTKNEGNQDNAIDSGEDYSASEIIQFPIFYNDVYEVDLPPNHRFPMKKYRQVREIVQKQINTFTKSGSQPNVFADFHVSPLATQDELSTTHSPHYIDRYLNANLTSRELRNIGFPWSPAGVNRTLSSVGGTIAAARTVCERLNLRKSKQESERNINSNNQIICNEKSMPAWSAHVAGGTHHAFYDYGEGFCIFSDIAVAANVILREFPHVVRNILIIDLDVHQGNGNAKLFQGRDDVFTFSVHCEHNLFSAEEKSDLDIGLPAGCTDTTYTQTLNHWLNVFDKNQDKYDVIFFQAGVDVIDEDRLGKMNLSKEGLRRRNQMVYEFARRTKKGLIITMGGGYPMSDWNPILDAHADVYLGAYHFLNETGSNLG